MIRIGTRTSPLALAQTQIVIDALKKHHGDLEKIEIITMETQGDKILNKALSEFGGKGLFTAELEECLLNGSIDCAVHSFKDMPSTLHELLEIAATVEREDPRDAFLSIHYKSLKDLPEGSLVGTSSLRRSTFISKFYPHLQVKLLRGNVGTRIQKLENGEYDGIILAFAGLKRINALNHIKEILSVDTFIPAPAQGVLCVEVLKSNSKIKKLLSPIHHEETFFIASMERLFLSLLDGSCKTPIASFLEKTSDDFYDFWYMAENSQKEAVSQFILKIAKEDVASRIENLALTLKKNSDAA